VIAMFVQWYCALLFFLDIDIDLSLDIFKNSEAGLLGI
jgi:hypothetical protein